MRVSFCRARVRTPAPRCQRSQLPLFQDFYNWGEAVGRINAPTKDRVGQLFNGIVITRSLDIYMSITSCSLAAFPSSSFSSFAHPRPRVSYFCRPRSSCPASFFAFSVLGLAALLRYVHLARALVFSRFLVSFAVPIVLCRYQLPRYAGFSLLSSFNSLVLH